MSKIILIILTLLLIFFQTLCTAGSKSEIQTWLNVLKQYAKADTHRTGTKEDIAFNHWLSNQLEIQGKLHNQKIETQLFNWPLRIFNLVDHQLKVDNIIFDNFPFWYPKTTHPNGIQAPLFLWDGNENIDLSGKIVLYRLAPENIKMHFNVAPLLRKAALQGALAAVVILNHPIKEISAQNAVQPYHQTILPLPALIAREADAAQLQALALKGAVANFLLTGSSKQGIAQNIIGRIDRNADQWIIISTPTSGWFKATNERGPGIAMWLDLARWVTHNNIKANFLFLGISGHELGNMGMEKLVKSNFLPKPEKVSLWLHLGSGIAVNDPLLSAVSCVDSLSQKVKALLIKNSATIYFPEKKMPKGSEQYKAMQLGYPVVGLFGADASIHTRLDQAPSINNKTYQVTQQALQELIIQRINPLTYNYRIYLWDNKGLITPITPENGFFTHSSISPLGKGAVFWGGNNGNGLPQLWYRNFSGRDMVPLTPPDMAAMTPSFDMQGKRITFVSDRDVQERGLILSQMVEAWRTKTYSYPGHFNIYVMDADGSNIHQVTHGAYQDRRPAFSPDGKTIVFMSNRGKSPLGLYTVPINGLEEPKKIFQAGWAARPFFSADGQWIFFFTDVRKKGDGWESVFPVKDTFVSQEGIHRRICRIPTTGGAWEPVTPEGLPRSHGVFPDPDGQHIWFHSSKDGIANIYRFNLVSKELKLMQPTGFKNAAHVTRAVNGNMTFDVPGGVH